VVDESGKMDLAFVLLLLTSVCSSALAGLDSQGSICCSNLFLLIFKLCKDLAVVFISSLPFLCHGLAFNLIEI